MRRSCGTDPTIGEQSSPAVRPVESEARGDAGRAARPVLLRTARTPYLRDVLHVYALCAFALAQPLFDRLSGHTTFLLDRGVTGRHLILLAVMLVLGPPTVLALIEALARACHPVLQRLVHGVFVAGLLVLLSSSPARHLAEWPVLSDAGIACYLALAIAAGLAVCLTWLYFRTRWFPGIVTCASLAVVLFPAAFLLGGPARTLVAPRSAAVAPARAQRPAPIVLIVFDEFCGMSLWNEAHRIDPVRYPNFARLADSATWYRNATTVHPRTGNALPAILTGSLPHGQDRPASEAEYPHNLFRVLQDSEQFDFVVFESVGRLASNTLNHERQELSPSSLTRIAGIAPTLGLVYLHTVLPANLPYETPRLPEEWFGLQSNWGERPALGRGVVRNSWGADRDLQCRRFLECLQAYPKPGLYFIHLCLPHYPWCYLPSGRRYRDDRASFDGPLGAFDSSGLSGEVWTDDPLLVQQSWRQYLLQVGYADWFLGQLQDRLREQGLWDDCLLVVTADHGVSFRPGLSRREPEGANLPDILSVPLLIKYPHQAAGRVDDRNVESIDILPTIAHELELSLPFPVEGSAVTDPRLPPRPRKTLMRSDGELLVVDPAFPQKLDGLHTMLDVFGSGTAADRLWRLGPYPELTGRPVAELRQADSTGVRLELEPGDDADAVRPAAYAPCYIGGWVVARGRHTGPLSLAVSVNGVIAGVTRTSTDPRIGDRFSALVPESRLSAAGHDVQVFVVLEEAGETVLEPCESRETPPFAPRLY